MFLQKKFLLLFLVLALTAGFAVAEEESDDAGIGFTAGLEFGVLDANKPNGDDEYPWLDINLGYENSFLDGTLDVSADLTYEIGFPKDADKDHLLVLDVVVGYNLSLGDTSTLSFIVENENDIQLAPQEDDTDLGLIKPGIGFSQNLGDAGDVSVQVDIPVAYLYYGMEKDNKVFGLDATLGWDSSFGLGITGTWHFLLSPDEYLGEESSEKMNGFTGMSFTVSYENGPVYADVVTNVSLKNDGLAPYSYFGSTSYTGITITPSFTYTFDFGLAAYVYCILDRIGIKDSDVSISPAIGVTFSF